MCGEVFVRGGIPNFVIDAVEDADHVGAAIGEDAFESVTAFAGLDLARITRRNGGDDGGGVDAAFEEVEAIVGFEQSLVEVFPAETCLIQLVFAEVTLVAHVVDCQDRRGSPNWSVGFERLHVDGDETRGPVVDVDDVRDKLEGIGEAQGAAGEEGEAGEVVAIVAVGVVVDAGAIEEFVVFEEVDAGIGFAEFGFVGGAPRFAVSDGDAEREIEFLGGVFFGDPISGHHDAHVVASGSERHGKGAGDIGEAPRFCEWDAFGHDIENAQSGHIPLWVPRGREGTMTSVRQDESMDWR